MPLPLTPIAGFALRYGAIVLMTYAATRRAGRGARDQRAEDAMDDLPEGLATHAADGQRNAGGRIRRIVRLGGDGPGLEIDAAFLGRLRTRRL